MPAVLRTAGEIYSVTPRYDSPRLKQNSRPAMPAVLRTAGEIYSATPSNDSPRLKQNSRPAMPAVLRTAGEIYSAAPSNDSPRLKQNSRPIRDESYLYNSRGTTRIPAQRGSDAKAGTYSHQHGFASITGAAPALLT